MDRLLVPLYFRQFQGRPHNMRTLDMERVLDYSDLKLRIGRYVYGAEFNHQFGLQITYHTLTDTEELHLNEEVIRFEDFVWDVTQINARPAAPFPPADGEPVADEEQPDDLEEQEVEELRSSTEDLTVLFDLLMLTNDIKDVSLSSAHDSSDLEAQNRFETAIRQKAIDENWEAGLEKTPEGFAREVGLYVDMEVNGVPLKAFVDNGALSTIISESCAERCGLLRLLDTPYRGVHAAPVKIGNNFYPCSFLVSAVTNVEFLFGLDNLRKHQCIIDLKDNVLRVGGGEVSVPFLHERQHASSSGHKIFGTEACNLMLKSSSSDLVAPIASSSPPLKKCD